MYWIFLNYHYYKEFCGIFKNKAIKLDHILDYKNKKTLTTVNDKNFYIISRVKLLKELCFKGEFFLSYLMSLSDVFYLTYKISSKARYY